MSIASPARTVAVSSDAAGGWNLAGSAISTTVITPSAEASPFVTV